MKDDPRTNRPFSREIGLFEYYYYYQRWGTKRPRHKSVVITNPTLARTFITVINWFEYRSLSALYFWIQLTERLARARADLDTARDWDHDLITRCGTTCGEEPRVYSGRGFEADSREGKKAS